MKKGFSLLVASLAATACVQAQVITYDLTYVTSDSSSLVGQATIDTSDPAANEVQFDEGMPSWLQSLTFTYTSGATVNTSTRSDFTGIAWEPDTATIDWNSDLVPQFFDINFFGSELEGVEIFTIQHLDSGDTYTLTSMTPIPEPWQYSLVAGLGLISLAAYRRVSRQKTETLTA